VPYRWDAPDGSRTVYLECGVVEELRSSAMRASLALPRRGAEVGGLLLGELDPDDPRIVHVAGCEEIPCEHRYGASFVLSDSDRTRLSEALRKPGRPKPVVGLYRGFTSREPVIDAADEDLIRTFFRDPRFAFLLIEPEGGGECTAAFLFWNRDELPREPPYPPFRLEPEKVPGEADAPASVPPLEDPGGHGAEMPREPAAFPATFLAERSPEAVPPSLPATRWRDEGEEESERPGHKRSPLWLLLMACILLGGGGAFVYELWTLARAPRWTDLRLDAVQTPLGLQLSWDRSAPAVLRASGGLLVVTDGPVRQGIALDASAIRAGQFSYQPRHTDVSFRLEIFDGPLVESGDSLRVLSLAAHPPVAAPVKAEPPALPPEGAAAVGRGTAEREEPASALSPPVVLHEVQPGLSPGILARIQGRVTIPVMVSVSASGKVTRAVAESGEDSLQQYLATKAERAARLWRFAPARSRSGKRVAGTKTVYIVFARS
jgi:hypothetical protein